MIVNHKVFQSSTLKISLLKQVILFSVIMLWIKKKHAPTFYFIIIFLVFSYYCIMSNYPF